MHCCVGHLVCTLFPGYIGTCLMLLFRRFHILELQLRQQLWKSTNKHWKLFCDKSDIIQVFHHRIMNHQNYSFLRSDHKFPSILGSYWLIFIHFFGHLKSSFLMDETNSIFKNVDLLSDQKLFEIMGKHFGQVTVWCSCDIVYFGSRASSLQLHCEHDSAGS